MRKALAILISVVSTCIAVEIDPCDPGPIRVNCQIVGRLCADECMSANALETLTVAEKCLKDCSAQAAACYESVNGCLDPTVSCPEVGVECLSMDAPLFTTERCSDEAITMRCFITLENLINEGLIDRSAASTSYKQAAQDCADEEKEACDSEKSSKSDSPQPGEKGASDVGADDTTTTSSSMEFCFGCCRLFTLLLITIVLSAF